MKRIIFFLIVITLLGSSPYSAENARKIKAQDFELENMKGKKIKLSDFYKDKLVILDFWASWCIPCKKELQFLDNFQQKYGDHIQVIAINIDKARHVSKAKAYIKSKRYKFEVLFDTDNSVKKLYNVTAPPNTNIISTNGEIIWSHIGYTKGDEKKIEEQIIKWIESKTAETIE